jgi:hypothetical protein
MIDYLSKTEAELRDIGFELRNNFGNMKIYTFQGTGVLVNANGKVSFQYKW